MAHVVAYLGIIHVGTRLVANISARSTVASSNAATRLTAVTVGDPRARLPPEAVQGATLQAAAAAGRVAEMRA